MKGQAEKYDFKSHIKCRGKLLNFQPPLIMGILNVTPNSFYKGSRNPTIEKALLQAQKMINEGVDIIDIGGVSTRPKADLLSSEEELNRILPIIKEIKKNHPTVLLSVDTFRAKVAENAVAYGADIINDVYGGRYDKNMFQTVAKLDVPYILMHSRGFSKNMQDLCTYEDVVAEVCHELSQDISQLRSLGVKDIIIDPGFGFAKSLNQNFQLLKGIPFLNALGCPLLIGISRKSMIYKHLNTSPEHSLTGTTVLNTVGLLKNASIVRVHDVKEAFETRQLLLKLNEQ